jgi:cyclopropane fatty-acyl-phospholipid synthase-like methyltransferase
VIKSWRDYFDRLGPQSPLYRTQAHLYVASLSATVGLDKRHRVLDFGSGFGFVAALLAPLVAELWWWDPSLNMRSVAEQNLASFSNARYCDLSALIDAGPKTGEWQGSPFDLILVNSVAQYMAPEELTAWLPRWRTMLTPGGKLVLSDLIPPHHSGLSDVADLFRLGVRHGSAFRAASETLGGVAHYWRTRNAAPLTRIGQKELIERAAGAGLDTTFLPGNLTHFRWRCTAVLRQRLAQ